MLRSEAIATLSEDTEGTEWYFGQTWYHRLEGNNGISLRAFVSGATDHVVPLREYGLDNPVFTWLDQDNELGEMVAAAAPAAGSAVQSGSTRRSVPVNPAGLLEDPENGYGE